MSVPEFWISIVIGLGLVAGLWILVARMFGGREVPVDLSLPMSGTGRDELTAHRLLASVPAVEVRPVGLGHWHLVRRVTPGWVFLLFFVVGIFAVVAVALVKQERFTHAFLVDAPEGRRLNVTGRLTKPQVDALVRAAALPAHPS